MYNLSHLFMALVFVSIFIVTMMVHMSGMVYLKYLVILVYVSGVVVFISYISCMCWNTVGKFSKLFFILASTNVYLSNNGVFCSFSDLGSAMWMYLTFSLLFNALVMCYPLNLFKVSGSSRF